MSNIPKNRGVNIPMADEKKEILRRRAKEKGFASLAAYFRALATSDSGVTFEEIPQWGGVRSSPDDQPQQHNHQRHDNGRK